MPDEDRDPPNPTGRGGVLLAFTHLLVLAIGGAGVWIYDKYEAHETAAELRRLNTELTVARTNGASAEQQVKDLLIQNYDVTRARDEALARDMGEVANFLTQYRRLVDRISAYRGTVNEPANAEQRRQRQQELAARVGALVAFVKQWRLAIPYLCGLLDGDLQALDKAASGGNPADVFVQAERIKSTIDGQGSALQTVIQNAAGKPLDQVPCLCTPQ